MFRFLDSREIRGHSQIDLHRPIKWEDFSFNGAAAEKPFSKATSFSNLGYVRLPEEGGAEEKKDAEDVEKLFQVIPNRLVQGKNNISELGMSV
ncbi:hypothetical protein C362_06351 [Cryptococcus neoformans Bt1]|nr:hypothetical protein C362_06351 [Cryptococcus neoformans var. grubii Bt1]